MLLLCCQDKRILADFEAHFLEFKYASSRLVTFVIFARAADLFVYGNSNPHSYMTDDDIVRRARKCTPPLPPKKRKKDISPSRDCYSRIFLAACSFQKNLMLQCVAPYRGHHQTFL